MQSTLPVSIGALRDQDHLHTMPGRAVLAVAASVFVAICAHLSVPLWFTPVPLTLSDFAVVLVGLALGPATAFSALVLYLLEGACGLPVFSQHGPGGIAQLTGFTGGYLVSYPIAAALAGYLVRALRGIRSRFAVAAIACTAANLLILVAGAAWFAHLKHLSLAGLFTLAIAPFLPGQVAKIAAAAGIHTTLRGRQHRS